MSDEPVKTTEPLVKVDGERRSDLDRGEFCYSEDELFNEAGKKSLHFWPLDCPVPLSVPISPQRNSSGATWSLSGTDDRPTLSPSVDAKGVWHGWLNDGVARKC